MAEPVLSERVYFDHRQTSRLSGAVYLCGAGGGSTVVYVEVRSLDLALLNRLADDTQCWRLTLTPIAPEVEPAD